MSECQGTIVTFLFTDVEGSTRLWESDPRAMSVALRRHDDLLYRAIEAAGGTVFKTAGDAFCAAFPAAEAAIDAAVAAQRALAAHNAEVPHPLRVRMAIHAGQPEVRGGDFFGPPLNRVARLLATAHGSQILVSRAARELARDRLAPTVTLRDLGEHSLKDLQDAERVFQVVAADLPQEFPPLRTPRQLLRNVPEPATPLIGREREVAIARAVLGLTHPGKSETSARPETRLLTLTGPGGAGKTRLSLHLASHLGVEFPDGAAFVSLAALTDPALVPIAITSALELGDVGAGPPRDLLDYLRDRHLLLVLDNLEQVMGAAALVADLLAACPRLRVIATSRERLSLRGELELPLPPLGLPPHRPPAILSAEDEEAAGALEEIRQSEAVRLFVARARSVKPDFDVTADNADILVEICRRLDGLPLAIELAAARVRLLSPRALLERFDRFDRRLDVLSRGHRDLPARQQTMRDTIAWSYDLLDPAERQLFSRLAVFVGGATLEAAAAVVGGAADDDFPDLELLESLADKSLIRLLDNGDEPRVMMLETIRDYGQERLTASDDRQAIGQHHAGYFLNLAEMSDPLLEGREQTRWLDRLDRDQANLRAAIAWLRDSGQTEEALRLAGALWRLWWLRGDLGEGRGQLESLLRQTRDVDPAVRAKALNGAGVLADCQGDWETAIRFHEESLEISRRLGDLRGVAWSLNNLGVVQINRGDIARAQTLLDENLAVAEQSGHVASIATALNDLGHVAHYQGDYDRAIALFTRSLALFRSMGDDAQVARVLNNLGYFARQRGDFQRAHELMTESLALHRSVGDRYGVASSLNNLAGVDRDRGDLESAMSLFLESYALALEGGHQLYAAIALVNVAALTRQQGDERMAQNRYREALNLFCAVGDQPGVVSSLAGLADIATAQGREELAAEVLGAAAAICEQNQQAVEPALEAIAAGLRETMSDAAFLAAWEAGHDAPLPDVIARIAGSRGPLALRGVG